MSTDHYNTLKIDKNASQEDIKKAYRKMCLKWHPDRPTPGGFTKEEQEKKFKEINEAYSVLSNPEEKEKYDFGGHSAKDYQRAGGGFQVDMDFSSIFEDLRSFFDSGSQSKKEKSKKGQDILIKLNLSFKEFVLGTTRQVNLKLAKACSDCKQTGAFSEEHISMCPTCRGKGIVTMAQRSFFGQVIHTQNTCPNCLGKGQIIKKKCKTCNGKKFVQKQETISFIIPRGIQGKELIKKNSGNDGLGGEKGDIYIEVEVTDHRYFQRKNNDIHVNLPISFLDAILGNQVEVITLEGLEEIKVPAGTQSGDEYLLKNRGCYLGIGRSSRGNFYIHFQVIIPRKVTNETKEVLRTIEKGTSWNPNHDFINKNNDILNE